MTLVDLRKLTIRKQLQIRFKLRNGMECIVTERGIASVPDLKSTSDFNLEQELASASEFQVDSAAPKIPGKKSASPRTLQRKELAAMFDSSPSSGAHDEHDDE